jgi:ribose transport system ATP-binding protein
MTDGAADAGAALRIRGLAKSFGGARALKGIAFDVGRREIHGLLGQNGSGKSTFVKLLAGFHDPDPGSEVELFGRPVQLPMTTVEQARSGLAFVHQNLGLVPSLTVLENLRIASLTARGRARIDWRAERREAQAALSRFELDLDPSARLDSLAQVDRALLAIVRAFEAIRETQGAHRVPGLLVLDEPTPFLPRNGVEKLFALMRRIVDAGASVIFISHDIDEIREITDRATVLRDGEVSGTFVTAQASREEIIEQIVGRSVARYRTGTRALPPAPFARIGGLTGPRVADLSLDLRPGEIVGLTGLVGAGYEQVLYHLFGATPATSGALELDGRDIALSRLTPADAMAAGIVLLPGDRQGASGIGSVTLTDNLFLPDVARFFDGGWLRRGRMNRDAAAVFADYEVRPPIPTLNLASLSGGNAQKVLLAKWLKLKPKLVLLEEPTQGVDVGARQALLRAVRAAADGGAAVLCASSDHEQLADLCDRVLVFGRGRVLSSLEGEALTKEHIGERCYGAHHASPAA